MKIKILFNTLLITFIISLSVYFLFIDGHGNKPKSVSQEFWDDGIQLTILINKSLEDEISAGDRDTTDKLVDDSAITNKLNEWEDQEDLTVEEKKVSKKVRSLLLSAYYYHEDTNIIKSDKEYKEDYRKDYQSLQRMFGKSNVAIENLNDDFLQDLLVREERIMEEEAEKEVVEEVESPTQDSDTTVNNKNGNDWVSLSDNQKFHAVSNSLYNLDQQGFTILEGEYYYIDALDAFYSDSSTRSTSVSTALGQLGVLSGTMYK